MGRERVNDWWRRAQDWLLLPYCLLCGARGGRDGLCAGCRGELPWAGPGCRRCAAPLAAGATCGSCPGRPPAQDETLCLFDYEPPVDHLVQRLKFQGDLACARALGDLMARALAARMGTLPDALIPMPLHRRRLAARGFNQARELARPVSAALGVPVLARHCVRTRATAEQSRLAAADRRANVAGAFAIRRPVPPRVAIIDDVVTTGHTAAELARTLRRGGARHVALWVCARAAPPQGG